jgi:integrase
MSGYLRKNERKGGYVWQAVVNIGIDENGKRLRSYKTFAEGTTKKEAERVLQKMILEVENQEYVTDSNVTVAEFLRTWLDTYCCGKAETTFQSYQDIISRYLIPEFGRVKLKDLQTLAIQKFYNRLYEKSPLSGKPMSAKSVRNIHVIFNAALQRAVRLDILRKNPAQGVELQKCKRYQSEVFNVAELSQLFSALKDTDLECPVAILTMMGLRRGELLALTFDKVDFLNNTITIDRNTVRGQTQAITKAPKTDSSVRKIDAPATLMTLLRKELESYEERKLQFGKDFHDTNLIVTQPNGKGFLPDSFTQKFKRFLKKHGFKYSRAVHTLRHQNATLMLRAGVNPKIMQQRLGHAHYSTTMDIYSHVLAESEREAVTLLENSMQAIIV